MTTDVNPSNEQIPELLRTDPGAAFRLIYQHYYRPLCHYALRFTDSPDEAEDIIQSMLVRLWDRQDQLCAAANLRAYLYRSARNASLNALRNKTDNKSLSDLDCELLDIANDTGDPQPARFDCVAQAIEALPPQCKRIFELNRLEGYSYKEIAEKLNISHRTVDTHLTSAMRTLREKLSPAYTFIVLFIISNL